MPKETLDTKRHIYTVTEITQDIKLILENTFGGRVIACITMLFGLVLFGIL